MLNNKTKRVIHEIMPAWELIFYLTKEHHFFFEDFLACLFGKSIKHLCLSLRMTVCTG